MAAIKVMESCFVISLFSVFAISLFLRRTSGSGFVVLGRHRSLRARGETRTGRHGGGSVKRGGGGTGRPPANLTKARIELLEPAQWAEGKLPEANDDVVARDDYLHDGPVGVLRLRSLFHERHARGFFARTALVIAGDVTLSNTLELQGETATLEVGDSIQVERNELSIVGGLAGQRSGRPAPRVTARTLALGEEGRLRLHWFKNVPAGLPGNTVPFIRLEGEADFAPGAGLRIQLKVLEAGADLLPGEYLLLTAATIRGPLPKLEILDLPAGSRTKAELKLSPDRSRLLLLVTVSK